MRVFGVLLVATILLAGCSKVNPTKPGASTARLLPLPPSLPSATAAKNASSEAGQPIFLVYKSKSGGPSFFALMRQGSIVDGLVGAPSDASTHLQGSVSEDGALKMTEIVPKEAPFTSLQGKIEGHAMSALLRDPRDGRMTKFEGALEGVTLAEGNFSQAYQGSIGTSRARATLSRDGSKLTGVVRLADAKEDLVLEGTVKFGKFELTEKTSKGKATGTWSGLLVQKSLLYGKWLSASGERSNLIALDASFDAPSAVAVAGGQIVPEENSKEIAPFCDVVIQVPGFKLSDPSKSKKLADEWKKLFGSVDSVSAESCAGATADLRFRDQQTYSVRYVKGSFVVLTERHETFLAGVHPQRSVRSVVVDVAKGEILHLAKLLTDEGRQQCSALVTTRIKSEEKAESLTEAGYFSDDLHVSEETSVGADEKGIFVEFQKYEVAPWVVVPPVVTVDKKAAVGFFKHSPVVAALLH